MLADVSKRHSTDPLAKASLLARLLHLEDVHPSLSFESHQNISLEGVDCCLLKGDNIDALTVLTDKYLEAVDFCYIDPPYNTGSNFVYCDRRNSIDSGVWGKHAAWMSFMLPRLVLMHALMASSGVAAISIDDYEYAHLKILLDHVFGAGNHLGTLIVQRSKNGKGARANIAVGHEHVVLYGKTEAAKIHGFPESDPDSYSKQDEHGRYKVDGLFRKKGEASRREDRPNMFFPLYYDSAGNVFVENVGGELKEVFPVDSKGVERRWLWGAEKVARESWKLYASPNGVIYVKNYLTREKRVKVRSIWDSSRYLTERATNEITEIYGEKVFETPKPLGLIEDLITCCAGSGALILDYFCGTATTAHAAYNVNRLDGGGRKVILVEQNSAISKDHIAAVNGFKRIADISEHRLKFIASQDARYKYRIQDV